ncbi:hypothetical protein ABK249_01440 [Neorhizobium sp. Rsf11]|uniref:DUF2202 domain-containing protein n=1 Tax=Neorhizobium phenanthreniclasticum TaxID=3157917 RepID=A0ABV0LVG2_9HYPH
MIFLPHPRCGGIFCYEIVGLLDFCNVDLGQAEVFVPTAVFPRQLRRNTVMQYIPAIIASLALAFASPGPTLAAATLDKAASQALSRALSDEYHAEAFYEAVMARFGSIRPFANIVESERTHSAMLSDLMRIYGLDVPRNDQLNSAAIKAQVPATLAEACRMGVEAEIANRDLYQKELLPAVSSYADITVVFERLSAASQNNHLPAFERCASRK